VNKVREFDLRVEILAVSTHRPAVKIRYATVNGRAGEVWLEVGQFLRYQHSNPDPPITSFVDAKRALEKVRRG
jgi:hypothetical protein